MCRRRCILMNYSHLIQCLPWKPPPPPKFPKFPPPNPLLSPFVPAAPSQIPPARYPVSNLPFRPRAPPTPPPPPPTFPKFPPSQIPLLFPGAPALFDTKISPILRKTRKHRAIIAATHAQSQIPCVDINDLQSAPFSRRRQKNS